MRFPPSYLKLIEVINTQRGTSAEIQHNMVEFDSFLQNTFFELGRKLDDMPEAYLFIDDVLKLQPEVTITTKTGKKVTFTRKSKSKSGVMTKLIDLFAKFTKSDIYQE